MGGRESARRGRESESSREVKREFKREREFKSSTAREFKRESSSERVQEFKREHSREREFKRVSSREFKRVREREFKRDSCSRELVVQEIDSLVQREFKRVQESSREREFRAEREENKNTRTTNRKGPETCSGQGFNLNYGKLVNFNTYLHRFCAFSVSCCCCYIANAKEAVFLNHLSQNTFV